MSGMKKFTQMLALAFAACATENVQPDDVGQAGAASVAADFTPCLDTRALFEQELLRRYGSGTYQNTWYKNVWGYENLPNGQPVGHYFIQSQVIQETQGYYGPSFTRAQVYRVSWVTGTQQFQAQARIDCSCTTSPSCIYY